jgi:hypothetical protein
MTMRSESQAIPGVTWSWTQLGGLAGVIGVVLFVIGIFMQGDVPQVNDSAEEVRNWFDENGQRYLVADYLIGIAVIFGLLPFLVTLRNFFARAEGVMSFWPQLAFLGGIFFLVFGGTASTFKGTLAVGVDQITDDSAVMALMSADFYSFGGVSIVLALFFVATAVSILRTAAFATWLAWLSLALAIVGVVGAASPLEGDPDGILSLLSFVTFIGFGVVILVLGGSLFMRKAPDV